MDFEAYHGSLSAASSDSLGRLYLELGPACFARRPLHCCVRVLPHSAVGQFGVFACGIADERIESSWTRAKVEQANECR